MAFSFSAITEAVQMQLTSPEFASFCVCNARNPKFGFLFSDSAPGRAEYVSALGAMSGPPQPPSVTAPPTNGAPTSHQLPSAAAVSGPPPPPQYGAPQQQHYHAPPPLPPPPQAPNTSTNVTVGSAGPPPARSSLSSLTPLTSLRTDVNGVPIAGPPSAPKVLPKPSRELLRVILGPHSVYPPEPDFAVYFTELARSQASSDTEAAVRAILHRITKLEWAMRTMLVDMEAADLNPTRQIALLFTMSTLLVEVSKRGGDQGAKIFSDLFSSYLPAAVAVAMDSQVQPEGRQYILDLAVTWKSSGVLHPGAAGLAVAIAQRVAAVPERFVPPGVGRPEPEAPATTTTPTGAATSTSFPVPTPSVTVGGTLRPYFPPGAKPPSVVGPYHHGQGPLPPAHYHPQAPQANVHPGPPPPSHHYGHMGAVVHPQGGPAPGYYGSRPPPPPSERGGPSGFVPYRSSLPPAASHHGPPAPPSGTGTAPDDRRPQQNDVLTRL